MSISVSTIVVPTTMYHSWENSLYSARSNGKSTFGRISKYTI